jgi:hypothetical protein
MLFITEIIFRLIGEKPFDPEVTIEKIKPCNPIVADSLLGYSLLSGRYTFHYKNGYSFCATHNKEGERIVSNKKRDQSLPKIAVYGDSNFYGFGLNDSQTWTYNLQQKNNTIHVINHSVFGYSLFLNYLKFKKNLESGESPLAAVFLVATYDLGRQTMNATARKNFVVNQKVSKMYMYPYLEIINGKLSVNRQPLKSSFVNTLSRYSSFSNFVETRIYSLIDKKIDYKTINNAVIDSIYILSKKYKVKPIFALMYKDEATQYTKQKLDKLNCNSVYINYDLSNKKYSLLPYDNHPNAYTNLLYSNKIDSVLKPIISKCQHL